MATGCATKLGSIVDFFFGSSVGSREKDAALARRLEEVLEKRRAKLAGTEQDQHLGKKNPVT